MSIERQAVDRLLATFPEHDIEWIGPPRLLMSQAWLVGTGDPYDLWLTVKFKDHEEIVIWRHTGATYTIDEHGAVLDDPFLPALDAASSEA